MQKDVNPAKTGSAGPEQVFHVSGNGQVCCQA
jgi:hypothetical protein